MNSLSVKLAVAGALSFAGFTAMAAGLTPTALTGATVIRVGGATATNNALGNVMKIAVGGMCQAGTLSIFTSASTNNVLYLCSANAIAAGTVTPAIAAGTTIALIKESNGGSANGISPVATPAGTLSFLTPTAANISLCTGATDTAAAGDFALFTSYTCGATVVASQQHPDVGISDVDPGTFVGAGGVTAAQAAAFNAPGSATSVVGVTFNPIVSDDLFLALQTAQGLTSGSLTLANMPTMTSSQLRALFSGQQILASQFYSNGVQLSTLGGASGVIHLCRRGNSSGTMTSFKVHFLGEGCTKNAATVSVFATPENSDEANGSAWVDATNGGDIVYAGSGSGQVRTCVNYHSQNGNYAVGLASTESRPAITGLTNIFRYIRVDGQEPTLKAVMEGRYDFFTENTINIPSFAAATAQAAVFTKVGTLLATPAALAKVNEQWQNSASLAEGIVLDTGNGFGDTGLLGIPSATSSPTFPIAGTGANSLRTTPVNSQRRNAPGVGANNCNRPFQAYPSL